MNDKLTIVLPTHNRSHLLDRVLPFLLELGYPLMIIDSSAERHEVAAAEPKIQYVHCPGVDLVQKMKDNIPGNIPTPYVLVTADDMFPSPSHIAESIEFLEANPDFSAVQGTSLGYDSGTVCFEQKETHYRYPTDCPRASARILQHFAGYSPIYYAVQRTDSWRQALTRLPSELVNYNLYEFYLCMMFLIHGKISKIVEFSHLSELIPSIQSPTSKLRGNTKTLRSDPLLYPELAALKDATSTYLAETEGVAYDTAFRYVEAALDMYMARIIPSRDYYWLRNKPPKTFKSRLMKEWTNLLEKTVHKQAVKDQRSAARKAESERLRQAVDKSTANRLDDFNRIMSFLSPADSTES